MRFCVCFSCTKCVVFSLSIEYLIKKKNTENSQSRSQFRRLDAIQTIAATKFGVSYNDINLIFSLSLSWNHFNHQTKPSYNNTPTPRHCSVRLLCVNVCSDAYQLIEVSRKTQSAINWKMNVLRANWKGFSNYNRTFNINLVVYWMSYKIQQTNSVCRCVGFMTKHTMKRKKSWQRHMSMFYAEYFGRWNQIFGDEERAMRKWYTIQLRKSECKNERGQHKLFKYGAPIQNGNKTKWRWSEANQSPKTFISHHLPLTAYWVEPRRVADPKFRRTHTQSYVSPTEIDLSYLVRFYWSNFGILRIMNGTIRKMWTKKMMEINYLSISSMGALMGAL